MVNYQLGKIYKIVCNITDECYIGSTCQPSLAQRLSKHVSSYNGYKSSKRNKCRSYSIIDRGNYNIYLIESFPCNSRDELIAREGYIMRQYKLNCKCINHCIAGRTPKEYLEINKEKFQQLKREWYENNKEYVKEHKKDYYYNNREKIRIKRLESITCICGSCIRKTDRLKHEKTQKHLNYLKSLQ